MEGFDAIAGAAGVDRREMLEIWEEVKANHQRLKACVGPHDFSIDAAPNRPIGKRWRCSKCGGEVDHIVKTWYEQGLEHGRTHG